MSSKINYYILKKFFFSFLITFIVFATILFIGDFVEQFRKSAGKQIPIDIILKLASFNFPNLIYFTLPLIVFVGSVVAFIQLIKSSEKIVINAVGISNIKIAIPAICLYLLIGIFFVIVANPLVAIFDKSYSELQYKYIDRVDKFASITKNGLWLKQENEEKNLSSVLFAKNIKEQGKHLIDFMVLEYDQSGSFQGRLDGSIAKLNDGFWVMKDTQVSPKFSSAYFQENLVYKTNIKPEDISDSLLSPSSISIWRLVKFISFLEGLGYSAIDFKLHFYDLVFLPFFMSSLVLLASSLIIGLKQNDKFTNTIIYSLVIIFIIYFLSNLLDALGSTSQLNPIIAKCSLPILISFLSLIIYQYDKIRRLQKYG